jgi:hypothetical protein
MGRSAKRTHKIRCPKDYITTLRSALIGEHACLVCTPNVCACMRARIFANMFRKRFVCASRREFSQNLACAAGISPVLVAPLSHLPVTVHKCIDVACESAQVLFYVENPSVMIFFVMYEELRCISSASTACCCCVWLTLLAACLLLTVRGDAQMRRGATAMFPPT